MHRRIPLLLIACWACCPLSRWTFGQGNAARIDFSRDIRPILSDKCFRCHGPDAGERATSLRLDRRESALQSELDSGGYAIVAGHPQQSELIRRITADDPDVRMPPAETGKQISDDELRRLRSWIQQGATWSDHWAFVPPKRPPLPRVKQRSWPENPLDHFVLAKLEELNDGILRPAKPADRTTLIRRVALDLTGLPPTPEEVDRFLADSSPDAYARLVDRLLHSPRYGEHQARYWLDVARYGDTHGLHLDNERSIWPYRDWVIRHLNMNQPFDQFSVEQLAGDLLPGATLEQRVATGFHRCNVTTSEGGSIDQEYLVRYAVDRVETTATTWLGLTAGCAACHDHKFDPLSQTEFYQLFAYFFSLSEKAMDGNALLPPPSLKVPTLAQEAQWRQINERAVQLERELDGKRQWAARQLQQWVELYLDDDPRPSPPDDASFYCALDEQQGAVASARLASGKEIHGHVHGGIRQGNADWDTARVDGGLRFDGQTFVDFGDVADYEHRDCFSVAGWLYLDGDGAMTIVSRMDDDRAFRGYDIFVSQGKLYAHLIHRWPDNALRVNTLQPIVQQKWQYFCMTYDGSSQARGIEIWLDGQPQELQRTHDSLSDTIRTDQPLRFGQRRHAAPLVGMLDEMQIFDRVLDRAEIEVLAATDPMRQILSLPADRWTDSQRRRVTDYFLQQRDPEFGRLLEQQREVEDQRRHLEGLFPSTLVMEEMSEPRQAYVLTRGEYDKPAAPVQPGVPAVLPPVAADAPPNRLTLARWLFDPRHPLTARVVVNRIWQQYFGTGIVATSEDFGSQGEWPSHPELLDWLAVEWIESGWDLKALHRLIVTSATYRQSALASPKAYERDPQNRLLARGPRFRMDAEMIRDQALFASGLLVERIGGKSVKPYQPPGLWEAVGYTSSNTAKFKRDEGAALYRRSLYTFWKRTSPPPALQILDAPSREVCTARRARTNTPTAALVLMNDVQYIEAARQLATRTLKEPLPANPAGPAQVDVARLDRAFRRILARSPRAEEQRVLLAALDDFRAQFQRDVTGAEALIRCGESATDETLEPVQLAAWTMVANLLLNLDEVVVK